MAKKNNKKEEKLPRIIFVFPYQTGRVRDIFADMSRKALEPGKRKSASGKTYWETRKNRSDMTGKSI